MAIPKQVIKAPSEILQFTDPRIRYPMFCSTKFDGFRMLNLCGERFLSPALKDFPNKNVPIRWATFFNHCQTQRLVTDGEVWSPIRTFQELTSIIRSKDKFIPEDVGYYVFDCMTASEWDYEDEEPYQPRNLLVQLLAFPGVIPVEQVRIANANEARYRFETEINRNNEGIILRRPDAFYKHARCTKNEGWMFKFKQFDTHDARITGVIPRRELKEGIDRIRNLAGKLERVNVEGAYQTVEAVGSFTVNWNGVSFNVAPGRGFTLEDRVNWWTQRETFIGKHIEFKYMPHGTKDKPRIGSLVRFRPDKDNWQEAGLEYTCPYCKVFHHTPIIPCNCQCCDTHFGRPHNE